jgi:geranylgeranyl pyrophosphate synthase
LSELAFLDLIRKDLERVEELLQDKPPEQHEAIKVALDHLIGGGGKRLRPALALLSTYLCGAEPDQAIYAAAAAEMLHTATLIHDDLIDGSLLRRGVETLNASWPPGATVLTGDYVFARAAHLITRANNIRLVQRFAETLMVICNGEVRQMFNGRDANSVRKEYEQRIFAKTASLIALAAETGAILAQADETLTNALRTYGERLGLAFQVVDDVLDYVANEEILGKPVGSDLRQGLLTLPALLFLEQEPEHPIFGQYLNQNPSDKLVAEAVQVVATSPAIQRSLDIARDYAEQATDALAPFPASPYRAALCDLAEFTVSRHF